MKVNDIVVLKNTNGDRNKILELSKHLFRIVAKDKQNLRLESLETGVKIAVMLEGIRLATLKERYLRNGNIIEYKNGYFGMVSSDKIVNKNGFMWIKDYDDNLIKKNGLNGWSIKKIHKQIDWSNGLANNKNVLELLYEVNPKITLTDDEKVILKNINGVSDDIYTLISRSENGHLHLWENGDKDVYEPMYSFNHLFKSITHESGVHEIKDLLE